MTNKRSVVEFKQHLIYEFSKPALFDVRIIYKTAKIDFKSKAFGNQLLTDGVRSHTHAFDSVYSFST